MLRKIENGILGLAQTTGNSEEEKILIKMDPEEAKELLRIV